MSTDDEAFTYNQHVNRVAPIQAHRMIMKTLEMGVSEDRIARALNLTPGHVRDQRSMLKHICPEAVELLKDKPISAEALRHFKRVKPMRQIEMADLMVVAATYTAGYAEALVARTPPHERVDADQCARRPPAKPEDLLRMEAEVQAAERDVLRLDESYGRDVVNLTLARGYVKKLIDNARVVRHLASKYPDLLTEFQRIAEAATLES